MNAKIKYTLDDAGRKALLIAGGDGKADQTTTINIQSSDIDLMSLASDGSLDADATRGSEPYYESSCDSWRPHAFDYVPTAEQLLLFLRGRVLARAAAVQAWDARQAAKRDADAAKATLARESAILTLRQALSSGAIIQPISWGSDKYIRIGTTDLRVSDADIGPDVQRMIDLVTAAKRIDDQHDTHIQEIKITAPMPATYAATALADGTYQFRCPTSAGDSPWAKHLERIDSAAKNGYAFEGPWLRAGTAEILSAGELVICGSKQWRGSKKHGDWQYNKELYVVTPAGLIKIADDDDCRASAIKRLGIEPAERVLKSLKARAKTAAEKLAALAALDRTVYAGELSEIETRIAAWQAVSAACAKALQAPEPPDAAIIDIDSAAAAIVAAGYKALAKIHHPDAGMTGSDATMALITAARAQLRDMLKLAGVR